MVCGRPPSRHFPRGTFIWTNQIRGIKMGKGLLLWLIGIPIPIILPAGLALRRAPLSSGRWAVQPMAETETIVPTRCVSNPTRASNHCDIN
jgi:hypothetical protein